MRGHFLRAAAGLGGALWTPAEITTALWFDAADADTIVESSGAVSQWDDKSGNARHIRQLAAAAQPTTNLTAINSKNVLSFDGNDVLVSAGNVPMGLTPRSFFAVFRQATNVDFCGVLVLAPSSGTDFEGQTSIAYETGSSTRLLAVVGSASSTYYATVTGSGATPLGVYGEVMSGTSGTVYRDGTAGSTDSSFAVFASASTGNIVVGGRYLSSGIPLTNRITGDIAEIVYCESALGEPNRQRMEGYLAHKWGLAGNLPGGHPYKNSAPTI